MSRIRVSGSGLVLQEPQPRIRKIAPCRIGSSSRFAQHGYEGTALGAIAAAELSRGAPNYFFGSKQELYLAVLELAVAARQEATQQAFEPVHTRCAGEGDLDDLREAMRAAADGYTGFQLVVRQASACAAAPGVPPR